MPMDISALKSKKIVELNELAKDLKIDGFSDLRKQELIFKILEAQTEKEALITQLRETLEDASMQSQWTKKSEQEAAMVGSLKNVPFVYNIYVA